MQAEVDGIVQIGESLYLNGNRSRSLIVIRSNGLQLRAILATDCGCQLIHAGESLYLSSRPRRIFHFVDCLHHSTGTGFFLGRIIGRCALNQNISSIAYHNLFAAELGIRCGCTRQLDILKHTVISISIFYCIRTFKRSTELKLRCTGLAIKIDFLCL